MDETPRKLHPRTVALLQQARHSAPPRSPERPLQLIPVDPPAQPAKAQPPKAQPPKAQPPKAQPPKAQPPKAALRVTLTGAPVGVTPLLPGLGLGAPTRAPRAPQRSVRDGVFAALSAPDAPLTDVVIFDTETTGRDDDARLVEIGALRVRDGKVVEQFQTLVDPEVRIPRDAMEVHGITDAMVRGAPRARPVLRAFVDFVGDRPLMAHNASFDRRIVGQELARVGLRPPGIPLFCSLRLSKRVFPQAPGYSLKKLRDYLQIPDPPAHRAIADCMTTLGLLLACAGRHPLRTLHVVHGAVTAL